MMHRGKKVIDGNHHSATHKGTTMQDMMKLTKLPSPKVSPFFTPQRLIVQAPLDTNGRPQTTFTVQSKLIEQLPPNCMCYLESVFINNMIGFTSTNKYGNFTATLLGATLSFTNGLSAASSLIVKNNPNNLTFGQYDLVTCRTSEGYNLIGYISTASQLAPQITFIDPTSVNAGNSAIPIVGASPSYATTGTYGTQDVNFQFCGYNAYGSAMLGMSCINIEMMDYTNPNVFDTNAGAYSRIIATVPTPSVYVRQNLPQELQMFWSALLNQVGYPITDTSFLNNNGITFRITYNSGGANNVIPQPAAQNSVVPFNLAPNYSVAGGNVPVPYGAKLTQTTGANTYTAPASQVAAPVYNTAPIIRFTLAFYPFNSGYDSD